MTAKLIPTIWMMRTTIGFYPTQPSDHCKPETHGKLNPHVLSIEDAAGKVLWKREVTQ